MSVTDHRHNVDLRIGDPERERTAQHLGQALAQGYLTMEEYERRIGTVFSTGTQDTLRNVLADLPIARIRQQDPSRRAQRQAAARRGVTLHLAAYLAMAVICLTVWFVVALTAGAWYFWPVWPILGGAIGVVSHALPVRLRMR
ncbi:MAG: DUF1707 domain-containing protein [Actinobacteria bacterium]|nr:DUF1707 domain-containing protein [Actinomycetota bacterium]